MLLQTFWLTPGTPRQGNQNVNVNCSSMPLSFVDWLIIFRAAPMSRTGGLSLNLKTLEYQQIIYAEHQSASHILSTTMSWWVYGSVPKEAQCEVLFCLIELFSKSASSRTTDQPVSPFWTACFWTGTALDYNNVPSQQNGKTQRDMNESKNKHIWAAENGVVEK